MSNKTEADSVAELAKKSTVASLLKLENGVQILTLPVGMEVQSVKDELEEYLTRPERRKGVAKLQELESLIEHTNRFKGPNSVLFANKDTPSIQCVFNYNEAGATGQAEFGDHRALYTFPFSDQWKAWLDRDEQWMKQDIFAEFIEERIMDIGDPSAAGELAMHLAAVLETSFASATRLVELSRGLSVTVKNQVANHVRLGSGETEMMYKTEHNEPGGAKLKVPGAFLISIPVFQGGAFYKIGVRLRYRVGGHVEWSYSMHATDRVFEHAFNEACDKAIEGTSLPLFRGAPE